ncbi:hypothetical protein QJS66_20675 [Kocuria rhizophila]|nr:hypothetical protein QJS66_20675 [Kocuria rhizophila]
MLQMDGKSAGAARVGGPEEEPDASVASVRGGVGGGTPKRRTCPDSAQDRRPLRIPGGDRQ